MKSLLAAAAAIGLLAMAPAAVAQGGGNQNQSHAKAHNSARASARSANRPSRATHRAVTTNHRRKAVTVTRRHKAVKHKVVVKRPAHRTVRTVKTVTTRRPAAVAARRRNIQAPRHFHAGAYRAPRGYVARRWSFGERLPAAYFARDYWLGNYALYGLFAPPSGLVWVRVGNDGLLIDEYTGEIVQVEYGLFY